jgi:hypothetical protein
VLAAIKPEYIDVYSRAEHASIPEMPYCSSGCCPTLVCHANERISP